MAPPHYSQYPNTTISGAGAGAEEDYYPPFTRDYSNSWEQQQQQQHHHHKDRNEKEQIHKTKTTTIGDSPFETPSSRPSEKKRKMIPKVTPLSSSAGGRKSSRATATTPAKKVKLNVPSTKIIVTPPTTTSSTSSTSATAFTPSTPFVTLQDMDIVCGRGAPTNYHIGNEIFRGLVSNYHTNYFCAKRSEKPHIAMKVLDVLQSRGARFVRRQKGGRCPSAAAAAAASSRKQPSNVTTGKTKKSEEGKGLSLPSSSLSSSSSSSSYWVEVPHKLAYEKVCQALRDGAPQVQRQILSSTRAIQESLLNNEHKTQKVGRQQQHQQRRSSNSTQEGKENGSKI
jgi:hypothetical protein